MQTTPTPRDLSTTERCAQANKLLATIEQQKAYFDAAFITANQTGEFSSLTLLTTELQNNISALEKLTQEIEIHEEAKILIRAFERQHNLEHKPGRHLTFHVGGMNAQELVDAIERTSGVISVTRKMQVGTGAKFILKKTARLIPIQERAQMHFIRLTVKELGFSTNTTLKEILRRAQELGLGLCPPDAGPHLRLHLKNQPANEELHMGMQAIINSNNDAGVFRIGNNNYITVLDSFWSSGHHNNCTLDKTFVFRIVTSERTQERTKA